MPAEPETNTTTTPSPTPPTTTENDGDTWAEAKAILDESTGEMRSYFWSRKTQKRVWDKPPSNAGKVVWWEQIAEFDSEQTKPQQLKIVEEKKDSRGRSKTPPRSSPHEKKKTAAATPVSKSVPAPKKDGHHHGHHHGPAKSTPPPKTTTKSPTSSSGGRDDSKETKPKERKEKIASLFVMAPQGELDMDQVTGAVDQEPSNNNNSNNGSTGRSAPRRSPRNTNNNTVGIDLRMSLPPPDGDEYSYEYEELIDDSPKDKFKAKPSTTVKSGGIKLKTKTRGDGDLWVEAQVLLNEKTGQTRSYFYSKNTQKRIWDEPPSGAGKVIYLKNVKRVYMRNTREGWSNDDDRSGEKHKKKEKKGESKAYKTTGKRQKPVKPKHSKQ